MFTDLDNTDSTFARTGIANTKMIPIWGVISIGKNKLLGRFDNPLPAPFDDNWVTFALNIWIWACIAAVFAYLIDPAVRLATRRTRTDIDDRILKVMRKPISCSSSRTA
ncbi:MAG: hypothetical protein ACUVT7_02785 [Thermoplasmata archaeon]